MKAPAIVNGIPEQFHMMLPPGHKEPSPLMEEIKAATIAMLKVGNDTLLSDDSDDIFSGKVCWEAGRRE